MSSKVGVQHMTYIYCEVRSTSKVYDIRSNNAESSLQQYAFRSIFIVPKVAYDTAPPYRSQISNHRSSARAAVALDSGKRKRRCRRKGGVGKELSKRVTAVPIFVDIYSEILPC